MLWFVDVRYKGNSMYEITLTSTDKQSEIKVPITKDDLIEFSKDIRITLAGPQRVVPE